MSKYRIMEVTEAEEKLIIANRAQAEVRNQYRRRVMHILQVAVAYLTYLHEHDCTAAFSDFVATDGFNYIAPAELKYPDRSDIFNAVLHLIDTAHEVAAE